MKNFISMELGFILKCVFLVILPLLLWQGQYINIPFDKYDQGNQYNRSIYSLFFRNVYYEKGYIGLVYILFVECIIWIVIVLFATFLILKLIGVTLTYNGKESKPGFNDIIAIFAFVFVLQLPFKLYFDNIENNKL